MSGASDAIEDRVVDELAGDGLGAGEGSRDEWEVVRRQLGRLLTGEGAPCRAIVGVVRRLHQRRPARAHPEEASDDAALYLEGQGGGS
jgi:hypothetical protein